jgi:hypothetical protein
VVVNNRIWIIGSVLIMVAIVFLGWLLGISPQLAERSANETNRQSVESQNQIYAAALASLKKDYDNIDEFRADLDELQKALPSGSGLSRFIGSLRDLEAASGVVLTNFGAGDPLPFVYNAGGTVVAPPAATDAGGTEATAAPPAAPPVVESGTLVQTLSPDEFIVIQIGLSVQGTQAQVLDFVDALQHGARRFLVTEFAITTDDNAAYVGKITGYVYVLIDPTKPAEPDDGTVTPTPIPTPSPTTSAGPSGSPSPSLSPSPSATP